MHPRCFTHGKILNPYLSLFFARSYHLRQHLIATIGSNLAQPSAQGCKQLTMLLGVINGLTSIEPERFRSPPVSHEPPLSAEFRTVVVKSFVTSDPSAFSSVELSNDVEDSGEGSSSLISGSTRLNISHLSLAPISVGVREVRADQHFF